MREVADRASELTNLATEVSDSAREVTNLARDGSDSEREVAAQATELTKLTMHAGPTLQNLTTCTRVASYMQPPKCCRTTPLTITRS
jgi:methyl-accepting chemotaxis protein